MFSRSLTAAVPTPTRAPTEIFSTKTVLFLSDSNGWCLYKKKGEKKSLHFFQRNKSCWLLGKAQKPLASTPQPSLGTCELFQGERGLCDLAALSLRVRAATVISGFWVSKLNSWGLGLMPCSWSWISSWSCCAHAQFKSLQFAIGFLKVPSWNWTRF